MNAADENSVSETSKLLGLKDESYNDPELIDPKSSAALHSFFELNPQLAEEIRSRLVNDDKFIDELVREDRKSVV